MENICLIRIAFYFNLLKAKAVVNLRGCGIVYTRMAFECGAIHGLNDATTRFESPSLDLPLND